MDINIFFSTKMALGAVAAAPVLDQFLSLDEYEEKTPDNYFGEPPVLHIIAPNSTIILPADQFESHKAQLSPLTGANFPAPAGEDAVIESVDVWATTTKLIFWSPSNSSGLQISYPTISVTAQERAEILLELNLSDKDTPDEDIDFLNLRIRPTRLESHKGDWESSEQETDAGAQVNGNGTETSSQKQHQVAGHLFEAIFKCQDANVSDGEMDDDDEGGGPAFDHTAPGATGWITSENMADFMDENGNFRVPESMTIVGGEEDAGEEQQTLGQGAGRTRTAAEAGAEDGALEDETKWQRTG